MASKKENAEDQQDPKIRRRNGRKFSSVSDSLESRLKELQEEYSKTSYNKATNKHLGILRAKIAMARRDIEDSKKRKAGSGFFVKKAGDATVALVGFPSAGKSSLLNAMANARSKTADYAFTTTSLIPGMMRYNDAKIQLFDLPGIIEGAHIGAGGGRTVLAAAKMADLIAFVVDATLPSQLGTILQELRKLKVFINKARPEVSVRDSHNQGFKLEVNKSGLPAKDVETIFAGFGMYNSVVKVQQQIDEDELIALIGGKSCYIRGIVALNKIDLVGNYRDVAASIRKAYGIQVFPVSASVLTNLDALARGMYDNLDIMTVYLRPQDSDRAETMVLRKGSTIADAARRIHSMLPDEVKYAYVSGPSAKFGDQKVGISHVLRNGDSVTFKL